MRRRKSKTDKPHIAQEHEAREQRVPTARTTRTVGCVAAGPVWVREGSFAADELGVEPSAPIEGGADKFLS